MNIKSKKQTFLIEMGNDGSYLEYVLLFKDDVDFKDVCGKILQLNHEKDEPDSCTPIDEMNAVTEDIYKIKWLDRVVFITTENGWKFVVKYDEQYLANEFALVANLLLCYFGLNTPKMALMEFPYTLNFYEKKVNRGPFYYQSMQYVDRLENFSIQAAKNVTNYATKLGRYVAFCLFVYDFDNFVFLGRFIDNIIFVSDPEYVQMDIYDEPMLNGGNILIRDDDFMILDIRPWGDPEKIREIHHIVPTLNYKIAELIGKYFEMNNSDIEDMSRSIAVSFDEYMKSVDKFADLYLWASKGQLHLI